MVGASEATDKLIPGSCVTVSCAEGDMGRVYEGSVPFDITHLELSELKRPNTAVMVNLGNPDLAFTTAMLPNEGVGWLAWSSSSASRSASIPWRWRHQRKSQEPELAPPSRA